MTGLAWLDRFARSLDRSDVIVEHGSAEAARILAFQGGGEAVTVSGEDGHTILFASPDPSASAVLEELAHVLQHHRRRFADLDVREMCARREVEAKECLDHHADRFNVPELERTETRAQLEAWRRELVRLEEWL